MELPLPEMKKKAFLVKKCKNVIKFFDEESKWREEYEMLPLLRSEVRR